MPTLSEIATRASHLNKPKRAEIRAIILGLIERDAVPVTDASKLYAFFMPARTRTPKTPEAWTAQAMAVKDVRYYLNYLYSDGARLIATDGHRAHIAPTTLPAGYYDSQLVPVSVDARYPDIDRVTPQSGETFRAVTADLQVEPMGTKGHTYALPSGHHVNKEYWDAATAGRTAVDYLAAPDMTGAIRINFDDGRIAVIMPVRA